MTCPFQDDSESFEWDPDSTGAHGLPPDILHAQRSLPSAIDAERRLLQAILLSESRLTQLQKLVILRRVLEMGGNEHCRDLHGQSGGGSISNAPSAAKCMPRNPASAAAA